MALLSDAVMVLYWTIEGDNTDHDDWHTYEHMHERLSIPGFLRGTRWVARLGPPSYLAVYEVSGVDVATSAMYLARLNDPTPWTTSTMSRVRGMNRGFCTVAGSSGYGLGSVAFSIRFSPVEGRETEVRDRLARQVLPAMASRRGLTSVHLLEPVGRQPITREQSLRGRDADMTWVLLVTAYDANALTRACAEHLATAELQRYGISSRIEHGTYALHYTVTAMEVARTAPNPPLHPDAREQTGVRRANVESERA